MATSVNQIEKRLGELRHEAAGEHPGARANVVELVIWCGSAEVADEAVDAIGSLDHMRPSRAIVLEPGEGDVVTSDESVFCALPPEGPGAMLVCSEIVRLRGPADSAALPSLTRSLLLPDLPLFVMWLDEPHFDGAVPAGLLPDATRLVVDSTRYPATIDALPGLLRDEPPFVSDLAWTKITGWREVVAQLFDPPAHRALLPHLTRVLVRHVAGSDAQARLLGGWLRSRGAHALRVETEGVERDDMRPGSLVGVELGCEGDTLVVERPDEGIAITHSPALGDQRLALRVPPFPRLIADELQFLPRDRVFESALLACAAATPD